MGRTVMDIYAERLFEMKDKLVCSFKLAADMFGVASSTCPPVQNSLRA